MDKMFIVKVKKYNKVFLAKEWRPQYYGRMWAFHIYGVGFFCADDLQIISEVVCYK